MTGYADFAECSAQAGKKRTGKSEYPEKWMEICGNCKKKLLLLRTLDSLTYGILCGLNETIGYEIYLKKEVPKNCPHKNEMEEE